MESRPPRFMTRNAVVSLLLVICIVLTFLLMVKEERESSYSGTSSDTVSESIPEKSSEKTDVTHVQHSHKKKESAQSRRSISRSRASARTTSLDFIPESRLKSQISFLDDGKRARAIAQLDLLDRTVLRNDINSLHVDSDGNVFYACSFPDTHDYEALKDEPHALGEGEIPEIGAALTFTGDPVLISSPPIHHSRPGSENVLFLDFNGGVVTGTQWNSSYSVTSWDCKPYGKDADDTTFDAEEQALITEVWKRVSENFAPFDIDVTTEEPETFTYTTAWVMITEHTDINGTALPHSGYGGLAYIDVFGMTPDPWGRSYNTFSPAWVNEYTSIPYSAYAIAHEIGHNLGLGHDGDSGNEYYSGHDSGPYEWGVIMGSSTSDVINWSKGDYYDASNTQDDLAIISAYLPYIPDDHGDSNGGATSVSVPQGSTVERTGCISTTGDVDVFALTLSEGGFILSGEPFSIKQSDFDLSDEALGAALDLDIKLYDSGNSLVTTNELTDSIDAGFELYLPSGTYYLHIEPSAEGTPLSNPPSGYTNYGILGTYTLTMESVSSLSITFDAGDHGSITSGILSQSVNYGTTAVLPRITADSGYIFSGWDSNPYNVTRSGTITAQYIKENVTTFLDVDPTVHNGWDTTPESDFNWVATAGDFFGSGTLRNELTSTWGDICELTYTSTFNAGNVEFDYKRDGNYVWAEFFIDGVEQSMFVDDGQPFQSFSFPISAGAHTLKWKCIQGRDNYAWIRNITFPETEEYTVSFKSGGNGTLSGTAFQTVISGISTTAVQAIAGSGYTFYQWSDGVTDNPRVVSNVTDNAVLVAQFTPEVISTQTINLSQGKNLVALRVIPGNKLLTVVLAGVLDNLKYVRDSKGREMRKIDGTWRNNIGEWQMDRGYLIEMNSLDSFDVTGPELALPRSIFLTSGYTIVPFIGDGEEDPVALISAFSGSVDFVRDIDGNDLTPGGDNDIGNFVPGKSYLFKLNNNVEFITP